MVLGDIVVIDAQPLPTTEDQCKSGGWRNFPGFKSQGGWSASWRLAARTHRPATNDALGHGPERLMRRGLLNEVRRDRSTLPCRGGTRRINRCLQRLLGAPVFVAFPVRAVLTGLEREPLRVGRGAQWDLPVSPTICRRCATLALSSCSGDGWTTECCSGVWPTSSDAAEPRVWQPSPAWHPLSRT